MLVFAGDLPGPLMADQSVAMIMSVMKAAFIMCLVEACEAVPEPGHSQILLYCLPGCFDPPLIFYFTQAVYLNPKLCDLRQLDL